MSIKVIIECQPFDTIKAATAHLCKVTGLSKTVVTKAIRERRCIIANNVVSYIDPSKDKAVTPDSEYTVDNLVKLIRDLYAMNNVKRKESVKTLKGRYGTLEGDALKAAIWWVKDAMTYECPKGSFYDDLSFDRIQRWLESANIVKYTKSALCPLVQGKELDVFKAYHDRGITMPINIFHHLIC